MYIDPLSVLPDEEDEEFEDEYIKEEEKEKENWPNKNARISRKYEVIGTVLDSKVTSSSFYEILAPSNLKYFAYFKINEFIFIKHIVFFKIERKYFYCSYSIFLPQNLNLINNVYIYKDSINVYNILACLFIYYVSLYTCVCVCMCMYVA